MNEAAEPAPTSTPQAAGKEKEKRGPSQATTLVELCAGCQLWHTRDGDGYITVPVAKHREHWPIRSKPLRRWLQRQYHVNCKAAASAQAVQDAIGVIEGKALFDGPQLDMFIRVAERGGNIYLDLCDDGWRVVKIGPDGWQVAQNPPVRFRRCKAMLSLPEPIGGGTIDDLRGFLNVTDEEWPLVLGWLLAAARPQGPYPVLNLHGEQGSAKTTTARVLRELIDPNTAPVRAEPKEPRDLMIAANNGWLLAMDNVSHLPAWLSDAACRLSTGGGFSTRMLYENDEEQIFDARRPVIFTGIEELATRGDLLDRSIILTLPQIPEDRRRPESEFWSAFDNCKAQLFGSLLTVLSAAIRKLPTITMTTLPRMADFALWATAAEEAAGLPRGTFMVAYAGNRQAANDLAIESTPVGKVLLDFMAISSYWAGTATELLHELDHLADDRTRRLRTWPQTARMLSGALNRIAPNLRSIGVELDFGTTGRGRGKRRSITIRRIGESTVPTVPSVPTSEKQGSSGDAGDATGVDGDAAGTQPGVLT
jgi:hypothetical protein